MNVKLKGGFAGCKWCHGNGCMGCDAEREAAVERARQPIFTADRDDPEDIKQLRRVIGAEALGQAFGPGGGGVGEINRNAAVESFLQVMRKRGTNIEPAQCDAGPKQKGEQ